MNPQDVVNELYYSAVREVRDEVNNMNFNCEKSVIWTCLNKSF